jgi:OOP family OmpA-OmpF porin
MRKSFVRIVGVAFVVALVLGFAADAQAQGVYVGGAFSWATLDIDEVDSDLFDDNASAYKLFLGYEFPKFVGLEAGYVDFGSYDVSELEEVGGGKIEADGWTAALTGRIPLGKIFTVYGKVGYFMWDAALRAAEDIEDFGEDGSDLFYGAGVRLNFGKFSVLGEYELYDADEFGNDLFSLGLRFTF